MENEKGQLRHSITFTSGAIKELPQEYDVLKLRGSVTLHQDIHLKEISTHGYSVFHSDVLVNSLHNAGSCAIRGKCSAMKLHNVGNVTLYSAQIAYINSSGKLSVNELRTDKLEAIGMIQGTEINAKQLHLRLSSESNVERLVTEEVQIDKHGMSFSLFKKRLLCRYIIGKKLHLSYTQADVVEGETVNIGKHCKINTLYYLESYTISPKATVTRVIRRVAS
ncbi:hypothetical protein [Gracilibacillus saliphilus]|uniref:hypothetical protein n=1 Tax=Gracilibacillus saliphilus TaxID=543890 RepID=UPI0013D17C92|nr:hypothetical protein [Gracilibacillus saliphilus]